MGNGAAYFCTELEKALERVQCNSVSRLTPTPTAIGSSVYIPRRWDLSCACVSTLSSPSTKTYLNHYIKPLTRSYIYPLPSICCTIHLSCVRAPSAWHSILISINYSVSSPFYPGDRADYPDYPSYPSTPPHLPHPFTPVHPSSVT